MTLLNFGHPLTDDHLAQIAVLAGEEVGRVIDIPTHLDHERPFVDQVRELVDGVGLSPTEWQTLPILVNPPALNAIAVILIAELHGRMGHFPAILRLRPVDGALVARYEVAEVISLQTVRERARRSRQQEQGER